MLDMDAATEAWMHETKVLMRGSKADLVTSLRNATKALAECEDKLATMTELERQADEDKRELASKLAAALKQLVHSQAMSQAFMKPYPLTLWERITGWTKGDCTVEAESNQELGAQ